MKTIRRLVIASITTSVVTAVVTAELAARTGRDFSAGIRYGVEA